MDLSLIVNIFYALIGISIIIFIHELGHFLAAKKAGVRVERFSIGFDPPLFGRKLRLLGFQWGETEYVIGLVPFGGYVKMAGETPLDPESQKSPKKPDWLISKPAGSRAMVFAAGAVFNIVSAFFFFAVAFAIGVKFQPPIVGGLEPGGPAWRSGLNFDDKIVSLEGESTTEFSEISIGIALGKKEGPVAVGVERAGKLLPPMLIEPEWDARRGVRVLGVQAQENPTIFKVDPKGAAAQAGIKAGDVLVGARLGALALENLPFSPLRTAIENYHEFYTDQPIDLLLKRNGQPLEKRLGPEKTGKKQKSPKLGVRPIAPMLLIRDIHPASTANQHLKAEDQLLSINGQPVRTLYWNFELWQALQARPALDLEVEGRDGARRKAQVPSADFIRWSMLSEIVLQPLQARLGAVPPASPLYQAGLRDGDGILKIGSVWIETKEDIDAALEKEKAPSLEVLAARSGSRLPAPVHIDRALLGEAANFPWDESPAMQVLPGSAAARLGIETGSRILSINGKDIKRWEDLVAAVKSAGDQELDISWQPEKGEIRRGKVSLIIDEYQSLGLNFEYTQSITKTGLVDSIVLGFKRTIIVAKMIFLTLKGLVQRKVDTKNLSGPVGIVHFVVKISDYGLGTLIYFLALISVNLGIFNLLPFPILDGGHLLFLAIEKIKGSPVDIRIQEIATTVAFFLIIGLALYVTYNDLGRIFGSG